MSSHDTHHRPWYLELARDSGIVLLMLIVGWVYTLNTNLFVDIGLYDETHYLENGLNIPQLGLPPADGYPRGAPLYALWYWFLSFFNGDAIGLYYLNYKATTILPALASFFFLRASGVGRTLSVLFSFYVLFAGGIFFVWPRISHFAFIILLCGLSVMALVRTQEAKIAVGLVTALLASYVRPEFFLSFLCLGVMLGLLYGWRLLRQRRKPIMTPLVSAIAMGGVLIVLVGVPFASMGRSWIAFQQHYSLNASRWSASDIDPWTNTDYYVGQAFPNAQSVSEALQENPPTFGRHVLSNLTQFPAVMEMMFLRTYGNPYRSEMALRVVLVALAVITLALVLSNRPWQPPKEDDGNSRGTLMSGLIVTLMLLPPILSALVVYPRQHYLLFLLLVPVYLVTLLRRWASTKPWDMFAALGVCVLTLVLVQPADNGNRVQQNLAVITTLRSLNIEQPVDILEAEGEYGVYVGQNYNRVAEYSKQSSFNTFLQDRSIDMIVVSERLRNDTRFRDDPEWRSFLDDPVAMGFSVVAVEGAPERFILLRDELVQ